MELRRKWIFKMKKWINNRLLKINTFLDEKYPDFEALFADKNDAIAGSSLNKTLFKVLYAAIVFAVGLLAINLLLITFTEKGGVFGDFLGGVLNPILTFFTLFGLIVTIVIQRQELRLSRQEYEKTADALSTSAIETTFFNIIDLHHNIVDNLKVDLEELSNKTEAEKVIKGISATILKAQIGANFESKSLKYQGRTVFEEILNYLSIEAKSPEDSLKRYKYIQNSHNHILGHYFRNLYQTLKVINNYDETMLSDADKRKYTSILRAQLSTKELALLFINCLEGVSDSGQFKNLLIEFQMLEHLPVTKIAGGYSLAGSKTPLASDDMFLQYKSKKELGLNLIKYYGGAFGQNRGVPYNLHPKKSNQQTAEAVAD